MNGFDKRKEEKMKHIINIAFEMFNSYGINNVKITDVARAMFQSHYIIILKVKKGL